MPEVELYKHQCIECNKIWNEDELVLADGPNSYAHYFACPNCGGVTSRL